MTKKRVGGPRKEKQVSIMVSEKIHAQYKKLAQSSGYNMGLLAAHFIDVFQGAEVTIGDYLVYMKKEKKKMEMTQSELVIPKGSCPGLVVITAGDKKEYFNCVRGSAKGTVKIKKITRANHEVENVCLACSWRVNLEERWAEILEKDTRGVITDHIYCNMGSEINEVKKTVKCRMVKTWISQDECYVIDKGKKCPSLKRLRSRPTKTTGIRRRDKR